ncbi:NAD(P)H-dependent oxidoreductase [Streptomyces sp. 71268]|uniref:NADPH-dependent FMN reductase n=1 Tax=Streptomyces sp. 71268 TaxID=3002640 RepID=UPI0023F9C420|nr:NADPH-dependent FMN reductase [Streptomyces sp. 71268]WEV26692.1 NAD(P)H-dependent oxidoreductase [Streptomyces sp. 71268]
MRILAISGSLRATSSNGAVLETALETLDRSTWTVTYGEIGTLPHFNQDLDGEDAIPHPSVAALRSAVAEADALLFVSPEYAHGVPGTLKNAIDWLVSTGELGGKPTAVITASPHPAGGEFAYDQLRETLGMLHAQLVDDACLRIPVVGTKLDRETGRVRDEATRAELTSALSALTKSAQG